MPLNFESVFSLQARIKKGGLSMNRRKIIHVNLPGGKRLVLLLWPTNINKKFHVSHADLVYFYLGRYIFNPPKMNF